MTLVTSLMLPAHPPPVTELQDSKALQEAKFGAASGGRGRLVGSDAGRLSCVVGLVLSLPFLSCLPA